MNETDLRRILAQWLHGHEADMRALEADKPGVENGRSDGKRVRYVRHQQSATVLRDILALLEAGRSDAD